jgi:hypothetical protein
MAMDECGTALSGPGANKIQTRRAVIGAWRTVGSFSPLLGGRFFQGVMHQPAWSTGGRDMDGSQGGLH